MDLMEPQIYKDHHVTYDRFFTSPTLVYDLLGKGTCSIDKVINTQKWMPSSFETTPIQIPVKTRREAMAIHWTDRRIVYY